MSKTPLPPQKAGQILDLVTSMHFEAKQKPEKPFDERKALRTATAHDKPYKGGLLVYMGQFVDFETLKKEMFTHHRRTKGKTGAMLLAELESFDIMLPPLTPEYVKTWITELELLMRDTLREYFHEGALFPALEKRIEDAGEDAIERLFEGPPKSWHKPPLVVQNAFDAAIKKQMDFAKSGERQAKYNASLHTKYPAVLPEKMNRKPKKALLTPDKPDAATSLRRRKRRDGAAPTAEV